MEKKRIGKSWQRRETGLKEGTRGRGKTRDKTEAVERRRRQKGGLGRNRRRGKECGRWKIKRHNWGKKGTRGEGVIIDKKGGWGKEVGRREIEEKKGERG